MKKKYIKNEIIENFIIEKKLTKSEFCKQCHISLKTLNKVLKNEDKISILSIYKISKFMNVNLYEFFCA